MAKPIFKHVIERARTYIAAKATWTRYTLAETSRGMECEPTDAKAKKFCAYGALVRSAYDLTGDPIEARRLAGRAAMWITGKPTRRKPSRRSIPSTMASPSPRARRSCACSTRAWRGSEGPVGVAAPSRRRTGMHS